MGASAGRVLLIPKGDWNANTTYTGLDWVRHNGAAWVCKNTCTNIEPTSENTNYWQLISRDGDSVTADTAMSDTSTNAVQNKVVKSYVDNSIAGISDMTGATATQNGAHGLVPAPQIGDEKKVLLGDGTWGAIDDKFSFSDHDTNKSGTSFTDAEDGNMIVTDWTKNLLNPTLETTTKNGVTCTNNGDGTYTLNGTATDGFSFELGCVNLNKFIHKTCLLIDCGKAANSSDKRFGLIAKETTSLVWVRANDSNDYKVILNEYYYTKNVSVRIEGVKGDSYNNTIVKPMLTTDLSATYDDFVPYGGYEIKTCGKNLVESYFVTKTELQYEAILFIKADLQPDTDYVISLVGANGNVCYLNENLFEQKNITFDGTRQYVIAHTHAVFQSDQYIDGYGWVIFKNFPGNTVVSNFKDIQLEKGSKPTPFEPYTGETIKVTNDTESPAFGLKSHKGITNIISPGNVKCVYPTNESGKGVLDAMYNNELSKIKNAIFTYSTKEEYDAAVANDKIPDGATVIKDYDD